MPIILLNWFVISVNNLFLNKFDLDRSAEKIKISEINQQCLNAIDELNTIDNKDWIKKYAILFHSVYIQHTAPSPNYTLNTYRGIEYKNITEFVNEYRKINRLA